MNVLELALADLMLEAHAFVDHLDEEPVPIELGAEEDPPFPMEHRVGDEFARKEFEL